MKKIKFNSTWLLVASAAFSVAAIIVYASKANTALGIVFLFAATTMQIVGNRLLRKEKEKEEAEKKQKEEENTQTDE